jgi:hypothetical protein
MRNVSGSFLEEIKTHILYPVPFSKIVPFMTKCEKILYSRGRATDDNMAHALCMIDKKG